MSRSPQPHRALRAFGGGILLAAVLGMGILVTGRPSGEPFRLRVTPNLPLPELADTLAERRVIRWPRLFLRFARIVGAHDDVKPGVYEFWGGEGWTRVLRRLAERDVVAVTTRIPAGATTDFLAARLSWVTRLPRDSILDVLLNGASAPAYDVPGPTLEGYLLPGTYRIPLEAPLAEAIGTIVARYRDLWTPERRTRARDLGLTEREIVTLASILEAEARRKDELILISAVYHNRLRRGMLLQADPTVQYALPRRRSRLFYMHIQATKDHPYNTYYHPGLPPGPIGSPSEEAVDAALNPADVPFLYLVARPDGSHVFSTTLRDHINAKNRIARQRRQPRSP